MFGTLSVSMPRLINYGAAAAHEASIKPLVSRRNPTPIKPLDARSKRWLTIARAASGEIHIKVHGQSVLTFYVCRTRSNSRQVLQRPAQAPATGAGVDV